MMRPHLFTFATLASEAAMHASISHEKRPKSETTVTAIEMIGQGYPKQELSHMVQTDMLHAACSLDSANIP